MSEYDKGYTQATDVMKRALAELLPAFVDRLEEKVTWNGPDDVDHYYAEFVTKVENHAAELPERDDPVREKKT